MRIIVMIAACAVLFGGAHAAPVSVVNSNFEDAAELGMSAAGHGSWDFSPIGWTTDGVAGVWEYPSALFSDPNDKLGKRVGFANGGASIGQNLGATLYDGAEYKLSADFLHRNDYISGDYEGFFGFFVGDITGNYTILSLVEILDPGLGLFAEQSMTIKANDFLQYLNRKLGIIFIAKDNSRQVQFDNVFVSDLGYVVETPIPGAIWLFVSALAAGRVMTRRKKAIAATIS